jgi:hypothetical protein
MSYVYRCIICGSTKPYNFINMMQIQECCGLPMQMVTPKEIISGDR